MKTKYIYYRCPKCKHGEYQKKQKHKKECEICGYKNMEIEVKKHLQEDIKESKKSI